VKSALTRNSAANSAARVGKDNMKGINPFKIKNPYIRSLRVSNKNYTGTVYE
jgi:hypothetical protein